MLRPPPPTPLFPYTTLFRSFDRAFPDFGGVQGLVVDLRRAAGGGGRTELGYQILGRLAGKPFVDRKSTRLNSSHLGISYAVFCLKKKTASTMECTRYTP